MKALPTGLIVVFALLLVNCGVAQDSSKSSWTFWAGHSYIHSNVNDNQRTIFVHQKKGSELQLRIKYLYLQQFYLKITLNLFKLILA